MKSGFMLYRCDFEKSNPMQNQHWFYRSFEKAIEQFQNLLVNDIVHQYKNSTEYEVYPIQKEQMIEGYCHLLFHSDDEMIWIETVSFCDE